MGMISLPSNILPWNLGEEVKAGIWKKGWEDTEDEERKNKKKIEIGELGIYINEGNHTQQ